MRKTTLNKPLAVLISDVHYSLGTLALADKAFRTAIDKAAELRVPLVDCGDITNDKALLRAEVMNALIETMRYANDKDVKVYLLVGNHSLVNEKAKEHALNFLSPYVTVVSAPASIDGFNFIPYQSSKEDFLAALNQFPKKCTVITHQGFMGAFMGEYVQDKSSVDPSLCLDYTIFSGHYHKHQSLQTVTYIGNPYTLSFAEANDGPKGFLILNHNNTYTRVYTNLRKHVTCAVDVGSIGKIKDINPSDLVWVKLEGLEEDLVKVNKIKLSESLFDTPPVVFKLDKVPRKSNKKLDNKQPLIPSEMFDSLIETLPCSKKQVDVLKTLWKEVYNEAGFSKG